MLISTFPISSFFRIESSRLTHLVSLHFFVKKKYKKLFCHIFLLNSCNDYRLVVDFRQINECIIDDKYPILNVSDISQFGFSISIGVIGLILINLFNPDWNQLMCLYVLFLGLLRIVSVAARAQNTIPWIHIQYTYLIYLLIYLLWTIQISIWSAVTAKMAMPPEK